MESKNPLKTITRRKNGSIRVQTFSKEKDMTDQSFIEECDVNEIIRKYTKTGQLSHLSNKQGVYADISEVPTGLLQAHLLVQHSQETFDSLPSEARLKFNNSAIQMYEWLQNPQNQEEAIELGLMTRRPSTLQNDDSNDEKHAHQSTKSKKAEKASPPKESSDS